MTRKKIYPLLVLSSLLISPLYASNAGIVDLDEEQPPKSFIPFTSELSSKVRCAIHPLPDLLKDAKAEENFKRMSEKEFHEDKDPNSSIITKHVNFYKFGYYFLTNKERNVEFYKQLTPAGLDKKEQKLQQNRLLKLVGMHDLNKGKFLDNDAAINLLTKIAERAKKGSMRLNDELPPIDFKTTLIRTMRLTTHSLKPQPVDLTHHQSEFVEPISGRLFQFNFKTDYSLKTADGIKRIYPYDLMNEAVDWDVDFEGREDNQFTYSIFFRGSGEKIVVGNITLLKM